MAVAASALDRSSQFIARLALDANTRAYGSYAQLLEDADVDVVYIGLRNISHCEWTRRALSAGKHVLCEKPLGINGAEVSLMIEEARQQRKFLMQGYWSVFFPTFQRLDQLRRSGELGQPRLVRATFGYAQVSSVAGLVAETAENFIDKIKNINRICAKFKQKIVHVQNVANRMPKRRQNRKLKILSVK